MLKSEYAHAVDVIQAEMRRYLHPLGFRVRGRSFNRRTADGLTEVVTIQMGPADPPGVKPIPGVRGSLHGWFAVNLGVHVPEVLEHAGEMLAPAWLQDTHCCVRERLGAVATGEDRWWRAEATSAVISEVVRDLEEAGLPFLARYSTRDRILAEWHDRTERVGMSSPPRIVTAIILARRGERADAHRRLAEQRRDALATHPAHAQYVAELAAGLGLGSLDELPQIG